MMMFETIEAVLGLILGVYLVINMLRIASDERKEQKAKAKATE